MAKRRTKKRTHVGARPGTAAAPGNVAAKPGSRAPKSMVIRIGAAQVGPSVSQLVRDVRTVLEPQTATRLKERRGNKLRDYTTMAGPLGVTHLLLFSRSEKGNGGGSGNVNMRLAVTPRGPTMHFRVERYSLCKDVLKTQKRPRSSVQGEYLAPPLLVMNNFASKNPDDSATGKEKKETAIPKHLESLSTTVFQSLFPPINPTQTPLHTIKRVLLLDRQPSSPTDNESDSAPYILNLRHYAIETRTAKSVPKPLRRLDAAGRISHTNGQKRKRGGVPDLGKLNDVADYLLDPQAADGFTSGSDSEPDTDAEVEVLAPTAQRVKDRRGQKAAVKREGDDEDEQAEARPRPRKDRDQNGPRVERKGVKMHELGPRLRLRLTKVTEGMCGGKVMWHEYIHKSDAEVREMDKVHEKKNAERERRREEQRANVERKKKERQANGVAGEGEDEEGDDLEDENGDVWDDYDDDEEMEDVDEGEDDEEVELALKKIQVEDDHHSTTFQRPALATRQ